MKTKFLLIPIASIVLTGSIYSQTTNPAPYCTAKIASITIQADNRITNVSIGSLSNTTGDIYFNGSEYAYYNNLPPINLQKGVAIPAAFTLSRNDAEMDALWVFIDYNMNNAFEANEVVGQAAPATFLPLSSYGQAIPFNFNINLPATAQTGQTRMRIIYTSDFYLPVQGVPTPCNSGDDLFNPPVFAYGEIEDYDVNITGGQTVAAPVANFTGPGTTCKSQSVSLTDNSSNTPTAWSWTLTGGTPSVSSVQNPSVKYSSSGTYTILLTATNAGGTSATVAKTLTVSSCLGVNQVAESADALSAYPNPANGYFSIIFPLPAKITVYDINGKKITEQNSDAGKHTIYLYDQPAGLYFMTATINGVTQNLKLIKE